MISELKQNLMRNFVLDHLKKLGITYSQSGKYIDALDYEELKYELVLASFRYINIEKDENRWF